MSIDLEAIEARANAASEGPWYEEGWFTKDEDGDYVEIEPAEAAFIAHAREDIPALLAEVERLTNICKAQKASCSLVKTVEAAGLKDKVEQLTAQIASVTAERDAAVEDLRKNRARKCDCCAYAGRSERWPCVDCQSPISNYGDGWKWRGTQKGESDEG